MAFSDRKKQLEALVKALPLNILVWGAGAADTEHYEKRCKIRDVLSAHFSASEIYFSEDLDMSDLFDMSVADLNVQERELWHLGACDLCVVLDTSKGAGEEIAHFVNSLFANKLLILTHEKYKDATSFPSELRKAQNQLFYSELEYDSCNLVDRVLLRVAHTALRRFAYLY